MLGLRFCERAFSSCGERGPLFIAVHGPLTIAASLVAEHRLQTCRLSSCGLRAQLLRSMWDLPGPGLEPVSPALADGFSTTAPPGKPLNHSYNMVFRNYLILLFLLWISSFYVVMQPEFVNILGGVWPVKIKIKNHTSVIPYSVACHYLLRKHLLSQRPHYSVVPWNWWTCEIAHQKIPSYLT